jgi:hypothetical protein
MLGIIYVKCRKIGLNAECQYAECCYGECCGVGGIAPSSQAVGYLL